MRPVQVEEEAPDGGITCAGGAPRPDREDARPGWLGVVRVADIDATLAQAVKLGGGVWVTPARGR